jgi:hypothetical protein
MMGRRIAICRRYGDMIGIELLTIAHLLQSPVIEVRSRARYYYRHQRNKRREKGVSPWHENVTVNPGSPPAVATSGSAEQTNIVILNTIVTTGQDTFRVRWEALNDYARKDIFGR